MASLFSMDYDSMSTSLVPYVIVSLTSIDLDTRLKIFLLV